MYYILYYDIIYVFFLTINYYITNTVNMNVML